MMNLFFWNSFLFVTTYLQATDAISLLDEIFSNDASSGDWFGASVSLYKDTAAVGALLDDGKGSVYVFMYNNQSHTFVQRSKVTASDGVSGDYFGGQVSIYKDHIIIGCGSGGNKAYIFKENSSDTSHWYQVALLDRYPWGAGGEGDAVDINDIYALSSDAFDSTHGTSSGSVTIFKKNYTYNNNTNNNAIENWVHFDTIYANDSKALIFLGRV